MWAGYQTLDEQVFGKENDFKAVIRPEVEVGTWTPLLWHHFVDILVYILNNLRFKSPENLVEVD